LTDDSVSSAVFYPNTHRHMSPREIDGPEKNSGWVCGMCRSHQAS
jgi:hypothetical protein